MTDDGDGAPYWRHKTLEELTPGEWEALCDGCGRCCLNKLEDWDTGEIFWTDVACALLDTGACRCTNYSDRQSLMPDCVSLTPERVRTLAWLPPSCAYRLVAEGRELYWWHPLVSGDPETVHLAGASIRGRAVPEEGIAADELEDHLADWPGEPVGD